MTRRFLSMAEVADTFGVSQRLIADLVARGDLPVVRLGARRVIPAVVVDQLEQQALEGFDAATTLAQLEAS